MKIHSILKKSKKETTREVSWKVIRIIGKSDIYDLKVSYDINKDLIKIQENNLYFFSIQQDKTKKLDVYDPKEDLNEGIYKDWDYVTHGTIFEIKEIGKDLLHVGISFGGLLMSLKGKKIHLKKLNNDDKVFCFFKQQ